MSLSTVQSQAEAREIVKLCPKCALLLFEFWSGRDFRKLPNGLSLGLLNYLLDSHSRFMSCTSAILLGEMIPHPDLSTSMGHA